MKKIFFLIFVILFSGCAIKQPTSKKSITKKTMPTKPKKPQKNFETVIVGCDSASLALAKILQNSQKKAKTALVCNQKDIILQPFLGLYLADLIKDSFAKLYFKKEAKKIGFKLISGKYSIDTNNTKLIFKNFDVNARFLIDFNEPKAPFDEFRKMLKIKHSRNIFIENNTSFALGIELKNLIKAKYPKKRIDFLKKPKPKKRYGVKIFGFKQNSIYHSFNLAQEIAKRIFKLKKQNFTPKFIKEKKMIIIDYKNQKVKNFDNNKEISLVKYLGDLKKIKNSRL